MDSQARITQVKGLAKDNKEAITMLLSACADIGSANGALLSVSKFNKAAELILEYLADAPPIVEAYVSKCMWCDTPTQLGEKGQECPRCGGRPA